MKAKLESYKELIQRTELIIEKNRVRIDRLKKQLKYIPVILLACFISCEKDEFDYEMNIEAKKDTVLIAEPITPVSYDTLYVNISSPLWKGEIIDSLTFGSESPYEKYFVQKRLGTYKEYNEIFLIRRDNPNTTAIRIRYDNLDFFYTYPWRKMNFKFKFKNQKFEQCFDFHKGYSYTIEVSKEPINCFIR